jgi:peptide/nickel transport system permease protein
MGTVILRRLVSLIPTLLILSIVLFALSVRLDPDRAAFARAGGTEATPEAVEAIKEELGLDDPIVVRYFRWLGDVLQGDLGVSLVSTQAETNPEGTVVRVGTSV